MMQAPTLLDILASLWENLHDTYTQLTAPFPELPLRLTDPEAFENLVATYQEQIDQPELLSDVTQDVRRATGLWGQSRERRFLQIILKLERLLGGQRPHQQIGQRVDLLALGEAIQLLYLDAHQQQLLIYDLGIRNTIRYLAHTMGIAPLQEYLRQQLADTALARVQVAADHLILDQQGLQAISHLTSAQTETLARSLYRQCYDQIQTTIGDKVARQLFNDTYTFFHTCYDGSISEQLFAILPLEVTEIILLHAFSRHELEAKVTQATQEERRRREIAEQLALELERKKKELQEEKDSISAKVQERTRELAQERDRLDASIGSLPIGFLMTNAQHAVEYLNPTAKQILALPPGEAPPTIDQIAAVLQQKINLPDLISQCQTSRLPSVPQTIHLGEKFLTLKISPIIDTHGEHDAPPTIGTVILLEDVTEMKILERSKEEFFAIASHELRTPLTVIRWNVDILHGIIANLPNLPAQVPQLVSGIAEAGTRLLDIINDFLDISRLEQHRTMFKLHPIDIVAAITTIHQDVAPLAQEKHLSLTVQAAEGLPPVTADDNRLRQVMVNLISNAIKYTDTGIVTTTISQNHTVVEIRITDTGQGIPAESQPLLFRKFQMAKENFLTREAARSTGLGLYICKLLVEGMGGTIKLEHSTPGQGSTFLFTLPIATDHTDTSPSSLEFDSHKQVPRTGNTNELLH